MKYVKKREDHGCNKQTCSHEITPEFFSCPVMFNLDYQIVQSVKITS